MSSKFKVVVVAAALALWFHLDVLSLAAGQMSVTLGSERRSSQSATLMRTYSFRAKESRWYTTVKSLAGWPSR